LRSFETSSASRGSPAAATGDDIELFIQIKLRTEGPDDVAAVQAASWLDRAELLTDSKSRPGKPFGIVCKPELSNVQSNALRAATDVGSSSEARDLMWVIWSLSVVSDTDDIVNNGDFPNNQTLTIDSACFEIHDSGTCEEIG